VSVEHHAAALRKQRYVHLRIVCLASAIVDAPAPFGRANVGRQVLRTAV
jgi:hypothetical protein